MPAYELRISDWSSDVCSSDLDQLLHDLVGAAIDARHPRPAPGTRDRIFVHIARAAVELEAFVHDIPLQFGVPPLRRRSLGRGQFAAEMPLDRPVEMPPADLAPCLERSEEARGGKESVCSF